MFSRVHDMTTMIATSTLCRGAPFGSKAPRRVLNCPGRLQAAADSSHSQTASCARRDVLQQTAAGLLASLVLRQEPAQAAAGKQPAEPSKLLCDDACQSGLDSLEEVKTKSGLRYKDIKVGNGPTPPTGYQVVADYVAMTPEGRVFDSSLDKGRPYDFRVGSGQVVAGLDEGLASMKVGGLRRVYIPGNLSFPKGLPSGPGRPRVPPASPVVFDVQLLYIPGLEVDDE